MTKSSRAIVKLWQSCGKAVVQITHNNSKAVAKMWSDIGVIAKLLQFCAAKTFAKTFFSLIGLCVNCNYTYIHRPENPVRYVAKDYYRRRIHYRTVLLTGDDSNRR